MEIIGIIPAKRPDAGLPDLIRSLLREGLGRVIVVDDGSGAQFQHLFEEINSVRGCQVLHHTSSGGKGSAIKTGMRTVLAEYEDCAGVLVIDPASSYPAHHILRIARALEQNPRSIAVGVREQASPRRRGVNRAGNRLFWTLTQTPCEDLHSGLYGIPACYLDALLDTPGDHAGFETRMLYRAAKFRIPFVQVQVTELETRRSLRQAVSSFGRTAALLAQFASSYLVAGVLNLAVFFLSLFCLGGSLLMATLLSRAASGATVLATVRPCAHGAGDDLFWDHTLLFLMQVFASYFLVQVALFYGLPPLTAKILSDTAIFLLGTRAGQRILSIRRSTV